MFRDFPPAPDKVRAERAALIVRRVALIAQRNFLKSNDQALAVLNFERDELLRIVMKDAVSPADTQTPGWAQELITGGVAAFMDELTGESVYGQLARLSPLRVDAASGKIPVRDGTKRLPAGFVAEGEPIPVGSSVISAAYVPPAKVACISVMTGELMRASSFETILRSILADDASAGLDAVLLGAVPASDAQPAGLLNGVESIPSTGNAAGDVAALLAALGNPRRPVIVASLLKAPSLGAAFGVNALMAGAVGVILSANVPQDTVIAVDAADFATATGDQPDIDASNAVTLHMEDATPLPIVDGGSAASPTRNAWQEDLLALRLLWPVSWAMRRAGSVAAITDAAW